LDKNTHGVKPATDFCMSLVPSRSRFLTEGKNNVTVSKESFRASTGENCENGQLFVKHAEFDLKKAETPFLVSRFNLYGYRAAAVLPEGAKSGIYKSCRVSYMPATER